MQLRFEAAAFTGEKRSLSEQSTAGVGIPVFLTVPGC